jgi:hypothetical protein
MKTMRTMTAICLAAAVLAWGCGTDKKKPEQHVSEDSGHEHHDPGPHKGAVEDFGTDGKHHVEVVYDKEKKEVTVYVLGADETTAKAIKADKLTLTKGDVQVELTPQDVKDGASSRFVGKADKLGDTGPAPPYEVTGVIGGKQYVAKYKEEKKKA